MKNTPFFPWPKRGNTLVEYALPAAMVGMLLFFGATQMGTLFPGTVRAGLNTTSNEALTQGKLQIQKLGDTSRLIDPSQINIIMADGTIIKLSGYPVNLKENIESLGSAGTGREIADALVALAAQLKADKKIDEEQFNRLSELANQGHRLATAMKLIEEAAKNAKGNKNVMDKTTVVFEGQAWTIPHLSNSLTNYTGLGASCHCGTVGITVDPSVLSTFGIPNGPGIGSNLQQFFQAYAAATHSGAMEDPAVKQMVTLLSTDIQQLSGNVSGASWGAYHPDGQSNPSQVIADVASKYADGDSSAICKQGGTQDTGVLCPET